MFFCWIIILRIHSLMIGIKSGNQNRLSHRANGICKAPDQNPRITLAADQIVLAVVNVQSDSSIPEATQKSKRHLHCCYNLLDWTEQIGDCYLCSNQKLKLMLLMLCFLNIDMISIYELNYH